MKNYARCSLPLAFAFVYSAFATAQWPPSISGDGAQNQIQVQHDPQGTCWPHGTDKMTFTNPGPKVVYFTQRATSYTHGTHQQLADPSIFSYSPGGILPVGTQNFNAGCLFDTNGLQPPGRIDFDIFYSLVFTFTQDVTVFPPGACSPPRPPTIQTCATAGLPAGTYRLESNTFRVECSYPDPGHPDTTVTDYRCSTLCIDVSTQDGNYQQINCKAGDVKSEKFIISQSSDGCYHIQEDRRQVLVVIDPAGDNGDDAKLMGDNQPTGCTYASYNRKNWSFQQISGPTSPSDVGIFRIANQATGKCLQLAPRNRELGQGQFGGVVKAGNCANNGPVEEWKLTIDYP